MPAKIIMPDPDCLINKHELGVDAYALDADEDFPLYRKIKLIAERPILFGRRTAHMVWIIHEQRLRRGGDQWKIAQSWPALIEWLIPKCAELFNLDYLKDMLGYSDEELAALIAAERAKYVK